MSVRTKLRTTAGGLALLALVAAGCSASGDEAGNTSTKGGDVTTTEASTGGDSGGGTSGGGGGGGEGPASGFGGAGGVLKLQEVAEATAEVSSYRMAMTIDMDVDGVSGVMTMDAGVDADSELLHMIMDMSGMDMGEDTGMVDPEDMNFEMIITPDTTYMSMPMLEGMIATKWISIPTSEIGDTGELFGADMMGQGNADAYLDFLKNSSSDVVEEGREEVRGVMTTRISTVLDFDAIIEEADPEEAAEMREAMSMAGTSLDDIPTQVWVDDDGMVRKIAMDMNISDPEVGTMEMSFSIELYDFGEPISVSVPSPSDVTDGSDLGM